MRPVLLLLLASAVYGQFEAASVKPAPPSDGRSRPSMQGGPGTADPGQVTYRNVTLLAVIQRAFDVKGFQVSGPDWLSSERYEIIAKLWPDATPDQFRMMLQQLLAQRFRFALHHATREFPGYELSAGNGSKLKTSTAGPPSLEMMEGIKGRSVVSSVTARAQPLAALVDLLSREFRMPILDRTGLDGTFHFTLEFAPQPPGALAAPTSFDRMPEADDSAPNLISAIRQQLGLRLNPRKIPLDVLIVDRAEKVPTEN
jgi:uncharacterized protein (TIGR03435 family)